MAKGNSRSGSFVGTGAIVNVELGWIPNSVEIYNATDGTPYQVAFLIPWVVPFTSGGTAVPVAGSTIRGAISGATATIESVQLSSGTFAAGNAVGNFTLVEGTLVNAFGSENIIITNPAVGSVGTDDATVTPAVVHNCAITAQAASVLAGTTAVSRFEGTVASTSKGFTVGLGLAVAGKLIRWRAFRDDA
jgi:hypothetical protein